MKSDGIGDHLLGFEDRRAVLGSKLGGFDGPTGIPLPDEDSLIADNLRNFLAVGNSAKAPVDVAGGQNGPRSLRGPYDMREQDIPFHSLNAHAHAQPPPSQFHRPQLNHAGPFSSHAPNMNPQMKFMAQEGMIPQGSPPNMLRPPFHHPSSGLSGFDPPVHPMLQQMHAPGSFPPHLQQGFPGNSSLPPHSNNPGARIMQEMNPTQSFPFNHRQPNVPGIGMPPGPPDVSSLSNHPEALQRLFEMELRSNPKQVHPFGGNTAPNRGMQSHELNMGFGFR